MANQGKQINWLDYTINNNPNGVMKVLSDHGFSGYMAPQSEVQMRQCALDVMDTYGEDGIKALMHAHPEYAVFKDLFAQELQSNNFSNAIGGSLSEKINAFVYKNPFNQALFALGIFVLGYYVINKMKDT
jgi:hypothetical protein